MTPERQAFIADLEMVVGNLRKIREDLLRTCKEHGHTFDKRQEGRWDGSFTMVRGILADELGPMLHAWKAGHQYSRQGDEIMGHHPAKI
jgi:hypothetical protein